MDFAQVEAKFKALKEKYDAGIITEEEFKVQLEDLKIQDEEGRWWMIGYETGQWHYHDGEKWVRGKPPGSTTPGLPIGIIIGGFAVLAVVVSLGLREVWRRIVPPATPTASPTATLPATVPMDTPVLPTDTPVLPTDTPHLYAPKVKFVVEPSEWVQGQVDTVRLEWETEEADIVTIEPGLGPVGLAGSRDVPAPAADTVYTLVAKGPGGETTSEAQVRVVEPLCTIIVQGLNLRYGPGLVYDPPIEALSRDTELMPLARSPGDPTGTWIEVQVRGTAKSGWVNAGKQYVDCNLDVSSLPLPDSIPPTPAPTPTDTPEPCPDTGPDRDGDGLTDCEEKRLGTNPNDWDSDGDRLPDGFELEWGTDPKEPHDCKPSVTGGGKNYTLKLGDSLSVFDLAAKWLGDGYLGPAIVYYTNLRSGQFPYSVLTSGVLQVGMTTYIPSEEEVKAYFDCR